MTSNLTLGVEVKDFSARLTAADPIYTDATLLVVCVRTDNAIEMISNCPPNRVNEVLEAAKRKAGSTPGTPMRSM